MSSSARPSEAPLGLSRHNVNYLSRDFSVLHRESPYSHWQPKSPRSGAARIEVKYAIFRFLFRDMAVAIYNHGKSCRLRLQIQFAQVMQHTDRDATNFKHISRRNLLCPAFPIYIASDGSNRRNRSQLFQDVKIADISSVNDVVRSAQSGESFGTKQTMGIRNDANARRLHTIRLAYRIGGWRIGGAGANIKIWVRIQPRK